MGTALAGIAAERISVLPGPPALLQQLLDHPARDAHDLSTLRLVVTGAAVVPLRLVERLRGELGVGTVLTAYGLSEASGLVTMCRRGDALPLIATTSGRAVPGTGGAGGGPARHRREVQVRGLNVMRGYYADPRATAEAMTPDGWLRTGDIGILDPSGNLRITDRLKDMFIVGGFNAYPAEIEQRLVTHPEVIDAGRRRHPGPPPRRGRQSLRRPHPRLPPHRRRPDRLVPPRDGELQGPGERWNSYRLFRGTRSGKVVKGELRGRG